MEKKTRIYPSEYIYYRTDHHWTTLGAYYAYLVLSDEMGLKVININDFEKESIGDFYGTYYSKYKGVGIKPDAITVYNIPVNSYVAGGVKHEGLYDYDKAEQYDKYALFMYGNEELCRVESAFDSDDMKESLVIFKDSYANSIIPFLSG